MNYIKYDVYQVSVDYRYNSGFENGRRDVLMRLLKTTLGDKLLEFEIPLTVHARKLLVKRLMSMWLQHILLLNNVKHMKSGKWYKN